MLRPLTLVAAATLVWTPILAAPLFADDAIHIERAREASRAPLELLGAWVLQASDAGTWWTDPALAIDYLRPLVTASFVLDHALWGLQPMGYHLTCLLAHALTTLAVWAVARRLLPSPDGAFLAALLFAVHPAHAEAVLWASGRTDGLVGLFGVLAFLGLAHGGTRAVIGGTVALVAALACKENAVVLPVVLAVLARYDRRARWGAVAGVATVAAYLAVRLALFGGLGRAPYPFVRHPGDGTFLWNVVGGALLYLADLVFIAPVDPVNGFPAMTEAWPLLLAMGLGAAAVIGRAAARAPRSVALVGLAWLVLALLPVLRVSVGERFLYLPSVGLCLVIGGTVAGGWAEVAPRRRRWLAAVLALAAVVSLGKSAAFVQVFRAGRAPVDATLAALADAPDADTVAVLDLPAVAALGFQHAVRLERPVRVEVLSIAPHFLVPEPRHQPEFTVTPRRIEARTTGVPWLTSYVERAYRGEAGPVVRGERFPRQGLLVTVLETPPSGDGVTAFRVDVALADGARMLLLRGDGLEVRPDTTWGVHDPELGRWRPPR